MILRIAARELREHLVSVRFAALCGLALVLLPLGALVNARDFEKRQLDYEAVRAEVDEARQRGETISAGFGWSFVRDPGLRAARPPEPLSTLALGRDAELPMFWQFGISGLSEGPLPGSRESLPGVLGEIDFVFVTRVILGLLATLLLFDAIAGEREAGTLRVVLAQGVPRYKLVLGKYLGALVTLFLPLGLGFALSLWVLALEGVPLAAAGWVRVGLLAGAGALYLGGLAAVSLAVSAHCRQQRDALVLLLVAWLAIVVVAPPLAALAAEALAPVEAEQTAARQRSAVNREVEDARQAELKRVSAEIFGWGQSDLEAFEYFYTQLSAEERAQGTEVYEGRRMEIERDAYQRLRSALGELSESRRRARDAQNELAAQLSRLSPAGAFRHLAVETAGTGESTAHAWRRQARAHQSQLEALGFDRTYGTEIWFAKGRSRNTALKDGDEPLPTYGELPSFGFQGEALARILRRVAPDLAGLGLLVLLGLAEAIRAFEGYDAR